MIQWPEKTFLGGHPVLNFVNTAGGDTKARDVERLVDFESFLSWCEASDVISGEEGRALLQEASGSPASTQRQLASVHTYREAIYGFFDALVHGRQPPDRDLVGIEETYRQALTAARFVRVNDRGFEWHVSADQNGIDLPLHRLALLTSTLITQTPTADIRQCEICSWLFLDASPKKRRRWCSMALCGNRAKAQRHYYRSKQV